MFSFRLLFTSLLNLPDGIVDEGHRHGLFAVLVAAFTDLDPVDKRQLLFPGLFPTCALSHP